MAFMQMLLVPVHKKQGLTLPARAFLGANAQTSHHGGLIYLRQPHVQCQKDDMSGRQHAT